MGAVLGGVWTYLTGEDMLPSLDEEVAPETLPHVWTMEGCPDARYIGVFVIDDDAPSRMVSRIMSISTACTFT